MVRPTAVDRLRSTPWMHWVVWMQRARARSTDFIAEFLFAKHGPFALVIAACFRFSWLSPFVLTSLVAHFVDEDSPMRVYGWAWVMRGGSIVHSIMIKIWHTTRNECTQRTFSRPREKKFIVCTQSFRNYIIVCEYRLKTCTYIFLIQSCILVSECVLVCACVFSAFLATVCDVVY